MRIANSPGCKTARRLRAAKRLKENIRIAKLKDPTNKELSMLPNGFDLEKAEKELAILDSRLMSPEVAANSKNKKYRGVR